MSKSKKLKGGKEYTIIKEFCIEHDLMDLADYLLALAWDFADEAVTEAYEEGYAHGQQYSDENNQAANQDAYNTGYEDGYADGLESGVGEADDF